MSHNKGKTFKLIIDILVNELGYHIIGVTKKNDGALSYNPKSFVRNSRDFGVPQNRPRTYIIGFDTERFPRQKLEKLPREIPHERPEKIYCDLNDLLEKKFLQNITCQQDI